MKLHPLLRPWPLLLTLISALALTACSEDEDPKKNNSPSPDMAMTDMAPKPDMGEDMTPTGPRADVPEVEPNDEAEQATAFEVGKSVGGFIDRSNGEDADVDVFKTTLSAGDVLQLEIAETGPGIGPDGLVVEIFDGEDLIERYLFGGAGAKRQIFAVESGEYYLAVYDARAGESTHGGATATYVIKTQKATLTPEALTFPGSASGDLSSGLLGAHSFTLGAATTVLADVLAARAPVESDLDPVLILWDPVAKEVVGYNDDIDQDNDLLDSADEVTLEAGQYVAIIDLYANEQDARYTLKMVAADDGYDNPGELTIGTPIQGRIDAPDAQTGRFDTDYFKLRLNPGQVVRLEAKADGPMAPTLLVNRLAEDPDDDDVRVATALSVEDRAVVTINHPGTASGPADFVVLVDDENNLSDEEDSPLVGGAAYGYTLSAQLATWTPAAANLPLDQRVALPQGDYVWYALDLLPGQLIELSATTTAIGVRPLPAWLNDQDTIALGDQGRASVYAPAASKVTVGFRDELFRGTYGQFSAQLDVSITSVDLTGIAYAPVDEAAGNTSPAMAQALTLPALVKGKTQADEDPVTFDHYKISLGAAETISVLTEADPDAPLRDMSDPSLGKADADTVVRVLNAEGMVLSVNDDRFGGDGFSGLIFTAPAAGDYTLVVEPYDLGFFGLYLDGHYLLKVAKH